MAFSLYGGRSSGNIISMANAIAADETLRYMDYVNVETAFSFTKYQATMDTATSSMGQPAYYNTSANGQYNWLLDYMQAAADIPRNSGGRTDSRSRKFIHFPVIKASGLSVSIW